MLMFDRFNFWLEFDMKDTYVFEFDGMQSMDCQCNQSNIHIVANDLQRNIQH